MNLNLPGQSDIRDQVAPRLLQLKDAMDLRKAIWDRLPEAKKRRWIQLAPTKDPIMDIALDVFKYLANNFFDPNSKAVRDALET